ncbi:Nif3-like dinuclear metal center hexameric protein [Cellulomonas edaphi]|uniref:GTP cyclohydrolase 1 type 2 homolog n=1 Tax=Cellulomonas edaphi TaxID=3053468 RepID=A0ABT7S7J4_9CELL|nr:Nif3-like dinuclear metal center hexameric protein [Cellulomons edaphi]MDM7831489.1 Nif3-like dinuclear metal center hexameric protein [Cellulomons edaphi]
MSSPLLADVVRALERRYPPGTAESWDAVGLVVGDPAEPVRRVLFAVDPVVAVIDEAAEWGADLVVTHHPLLLRGVHSVAATTYKGALVHRMARNGIALYAAHTNADAAVGGVADALAAAIGLVDTSPLVAASEGAETGIGRVGTLREPVPLREFATRVAGAVPATAQGVRFAGDPDGVVARVAVVGGSGDSLFDAVRAAGVDAYVTADLRHHPASELRERAVFEAPTGPSTPYLVDLAHFASEWPWLAHAARDLEADLAAAGTTVETRVSTLRTDPWTGRAAPPEGSS